MAPPACAGDTLPPLVGRAGELALEGLSQGALRELIADIDREMGCLDEVSPEARDANAVC
jgi:hypothetical protein